MNLRVPGLGLAPAAGAGGALTRGTDAFLSEPDAPTAKTISARVNAFESLRRRLATSQGARA